MNGSELYQYILDNTLHELKGTWEVTQDNELKVTGTDVNGSYVVFPDALTNFRLEWDMTILSSGGSINSGISPIILSSYQGSNLENWNNGSTITNAKFMYFICNHRNTTNFGSISVLNGTNYVSWFDSGYQGTFVVGTKYRYKLERRNGLFKLYQDDTLISSFADVTNNIPIYLGWYMWYGGYYSDYQANFIIDNYVVTDLGTDTTKYLNDTGLSEAWTNIKNYITAQLLGKSNTGHTHTKSEITDFPTIPSKTSDLTNDSGFLTSHQDLSGYVPVSGGAVITNYFLGRSVDTGSLMISGGTAWDKGGSLETFGSSHSSYAGWVRLQPALSNPNYKTMNLAPNGTWAWNGAACQVTSDQRYKQQITEIDDKLLDAWGDVELVQFKYNESVDTKGKSARLHTGYVVQQINKACTSHGVDITQYGLFCHEEYPEETKEIEVKQKDGTKTKKTKIIREANEHYSLRYTEALIVECKYLRRCIARLTARIEELEKGNNVK